MPNRGRPRARLVTGGPAWEERRAKQLQVKFTKRQKLARKPLNKAMQQLSDAVRRQDWRAARTARAAAWEEVNKLADDLTREERKTLWEYKQRILAGEARERHNGASVEPRNSRVWVRPPEADLIQEQRRVAAARTRAAIEERRREKAARKAAAKAKVEAEQKRQPREVRVVESVRTVSGGLPSLGKRR